MDQPVLSKPLQSSIRSFFLPRTPIYAAPSSSSNSTATAKGMPSPGSASPPISSNTAKPHSGQKVEHPISTLLLPPQASISTIHEKHIQPLKRINALLLPINYPDSFYHKILDPYASPNFSRVILWQDSPCSKPDFSADTEPKVIGGIVCRLEYDDISKTSSIYIQSLALLSPYRSHGLATAVLEDIIGSLVAPPATDYPITSLYAHVWTENTDGLEWYNARGFTREEPVIQDYYRRLKPGNAWIMRRSLAPSDHLRHSRTPNSSAEVSQNSTTSHSQPLSTSTSTPLLRTPALYAAPITKPCLPNPNSITRATSYQTTGPGHEWNDLPDDVLSLKPQPSSSSLSTSAGFLKFDSRNGSAASSRSSSSTRNGGKKKRQYPAAAFEAAASAAAS